MRKLDFVSALTLSSAAHWFQRWSEERLLAWLTWLLAAAGVWLAGAWMWQLYAFATLTPPTLSWAREQQSTGVQELVIPEDLADLVFGQPAAPAEGGTQKPEPVVENAPETQLNLRLRGVFASDDPELSSAIIEDERGEQAMYFVGDVIGNHANVRLHKVLPHRILIKRGNRIEALTMDDFSDERLLRQGDHRATFDKGKMSQKQLLDRTRDAQLTRKLAALKRRLDEDPMSLANMLRVSPYMQDGRMLGVQIAPGKDAVLFTQAGLRRNDVITSINGITLDNPGAATMVQDVLRSSSTLTMEVLRDGQPITLMFNLDESAHDKPIPTLR
jgi:general secretion pathway protein C